MFKWKDYGENSNCFIDGIEISVASIKHKGMELKETLTGNKSKLKSELLEDAKIEAEKILIKYWQKVNKETTKILNLVK